MRVPTRTPEALLFAIVETEPESIAKRDQRAFGGIGLRFLDCEFLGFGRGRSRPAPGTMTVADDHRFSRPYPDPHLRQVNAAIAPLPYPLPNASDRDGLSIPAVEAEDAVSFGDREPPFDVGKDLTILRPLAHNAPIQPCGKQFALF